ncbi:MAG: ribokinase [Sphaerochaeta sp.]|nr:ribokinase [Sphaerochaeta sp.]
MRIVNFGSTNIDIVFSVDHIVLPGETIGSTSMIRTTGGKGANQSVAVAKAGQHEVFHAGRIGPDDQWIKEKLRSMGVDTTYIGSGETPTGQAWIQVSADGQNSIVLYAGANKDFTTQWIDSVLDNFSHGDWVMLQNETNQISHIMHRAKSSGMSICFNPAPFDREILNLPLHLVDLLVVNEVEAEGLSGESNPDRALQRLTETYPQTDIIITLGKAGVRYGKGPTIRLRFGTWNVPVVDTTAAGDTFIGCYLANIAKEKSVEEALRSASAASSVTVMRQGAMDSIPVPDEFSLVERYMLS